MKIKNLSVQGFKSFMDRLTVSFPPGISGVVGPNGCGKSNIVDAIRWCMGEQSPKQLRGRRMEDVIFNGAGEYKPMGMAEVTLVFENGDGSFPSPFTHDAELSVTRRLYRSGESDYLINNVPCRLKDIQDIFMDTGLGNRAYSIISQGQIGTIIEQRPEETRAMLEEAAGITKYRRKVETAQRKIEATESNLQRVEDILGEVLKQMRSLKRQAGKARRYKAISEAIQELELKLYANSYKLYLEESGTKLKSTEDLVQQEVAVSARLSQHQAEVEAMNLKLDEMDSDLASRRSSHLQLLEEIHKKEATVESLTGEVHMLEEMEGRLRGEHQQIGDRITTLGEEKTRLLGSVEDMKSRAQGLSEEMELCDKRLKGRRQLLKESREVYEDARERLSAGENKEMGLTHESSYIHKMLSQITDSQTRLENERSEVEDKIRTLQEASERKRLVREETARKLKETEKTIQEYTQSCEEMERAKEEVERELKRADAELTGCQSRLASLKSLTDNFEGYKVGVRTIMKATDLEPRQQGRILGLVADMLQVDSRYEQAVEAVLADKLQYVIVESQEDGVKAVDYLKKRARGRSSFVSLQEMNGNGRPKPTGGHFPRLSEFVSVPEPYRPVVEALLGGTELVENLGEAIAAWNSNGKDRCFVTPDGDMVDERGVISGGKLTQSSVGILGRKREMKELTAESARLQSHADQLNRKLGQISEEIRVKKDALQNLIDAKWSCQEEVNELDNMLFRLGQEMDQSEKLFQKIDEDLERKGTEQNRHNLELQRIQEELQQCHIKRKQVEAYFQEKEKELRESEEEFDQLREEFTKLQSDARILEEERRGLLREIERLDEYAEESEQRRKRIEEDIATGKEKRRTCDSKREEIRNHLEELYERLKGSEDELNTADRNRHEYQEKIRAEEDKASELRIEIGDLKEKINAARMEQSEIRFKMNNLEAMTRDKFNLSLPDIYEQYVEEDFSASQVEEELEHKRTLRQRLGEVNLTAIKEHEALKERHDFIQKQREDLIRSIESLRAAIRKINRTSLEKFRETLHEVDQKLKVIFPILFNGGTAGLKLTDEEKPLESGVLVWVQPPGKKLSHMGLLSGGEKALVAMAFLFAIYLIKPSPFCLLDEVDAPLDEANINRFNKLLREIQKSSQIIMITHNRRTMEIVDRLYGVTMEKPGVSTTVAVDIEGLREEAGADSEAPQAAVA